VNKAAHENFHLIAPGDNIEIWWGGEHAWVTVLAVELETQKRLDGTHFITGAHFTVYNKWSYIYEANGSQTQVKRAAVLHARRFSGDIRTCSTPDAPALTSNQIATALGYLREHGGPECNTVLPETLGL
jgi:hypothetical protein